MACRPSIRWSAGIYIGLECAAVWDPEHVVDRLRDPADGRPNKWVERLAVDQNKLR
ncbi:hypothetical protein [Mesorhizobium amorphae]